MYKRYLITSETYSQVKAVGQMQEYIIILPNTVAPSGSRDVEKRTGSCVVGVDRSVVAQAILCDDPHATRVILYPSRPCTRAGFLLTVVVPLPCWPWSLSPHAYTCNVII